MYVCVLYMCVRVWITNEVFLLLYCVFIFVSLLHGFKNFAHLSVYIFI